MQTRTGSPVSSLKAIKRSQRTRRAGRAAGADPWGQSWHTDGPRPHPQDGHFHISLPLRHPDPAPTPRCLPSLSTTCFMPALRTSQTVKDPVLMKQATRSATCSSQPVALKDMVPICTSSPGHRPQATPWTLTSHAQGLCTGFPSAWTLA